ncbi:hypothetical protein D3C73_1381560 [compost metagenome]
MVGCKYFLPNLGKISTISKAAQIPRGAAISAARMEVLNEPMINGSAPNIGGSPSGFHFDPPSTSPRLIPSLKNELKPLVATK